MDTLHVSRRLHRNQIRFRELDETLTKAMEGLDHEIAEATNAGACMLRVVV